MTETLNTQELEYYTKLENFLPFSGQKLLVLLKTPRFGEQVDNGLGMGIDFELDKFVVVIGQTTSDSVDELLAGWKLCMESFDFGREFEFMEFKIEPGNKTNIDDLISDLYEKDKYEVVWDKRKKG